MNVLDEDLEACSRRAMQSLVALKYSLKSGNDTNNFLSIAKNAFRMVSDKEDFRLNTNSLEDFVKSTSRQMDTKMTALKESVNEDDEGGPGVSGESLLLLCADIPSKQLRFFDELYGKHTSIKLQLNPNRIPPRKFTVEEYLKYMESQTEGGFNNRKLTLTQLKTFYIKQ